METFWALWVPFVPFGTSFGGPGEPNEVQKGAQERFYGYRKNVDFPPSTLNSQTEGSFDAAMPCVHKGVCAALCPVGHKLVIGHSPTSGWLNF